MNNKKNWNPIAFEDLNKLLRASESLMSPSLRRFWHAINIPPVKWTQFPYGTDGGGFWVVAVMGQRIIWFNDIEHGFNISHYDQYGSIEEYGSEQIELHHLLNRELEN